MKRPPDINTSVLGSSFKVLNCKANSAEFLTYLSDFLKVQLRKGMEPVGNLTNIEELHLKSLQGNIKTHMRKKLWTCFSLAYKTYGLVLAYSYNVDAMQIIKDRTASLVMPKYHTVPGIALCTFVILLRNINLFISCG